MGLHRRCRKDESTLRDDIINEIARKQNKPSSWHITNALEVAMHLRTRFGTPKWLSDHVHMKIHEMVLIHKDKDEIF